MVQVFFVVVKILVAIVLFILIIVMQSAICLLINLDICGPQQLQMSTMQPSVQKGSTLLAWATISLLAGVVYRYSKNCLWQQVKEILLSAIWR
jgi:hypothetical protein